MSKEIPSRSTAQVSYPLSNLHSAGELRRSRVDQHNITRVIRYGLNLSRQMNIRLAPLDDVQRAFALIVTICCHEQFVLVAFVDDADALPRCGQTNALTAPCEIRVHREGAQSIYKML